MPDRVHYHPNLIFSVGTQVVALVEVLGQSGKVLHPRGSVGVVVRSHVKGMPPLIYSWHINKIGMETAPFVETVDARGTPMMVRDEAKSAFQEIEQTDAWKDDSGHGEYVFECTLMDVPPKRERR
jgi:hypothetical protein